MNTDNIKKYCARLRLSYIPNNLDQLIIDAQNGKPTYGDFLENVLREETKTREYKAYLNRFKQAKLPPKYDLDKYDFSHSTGVSERQLNELRQLAWLNQAYNLILMGPSGTGKTYIASGLVYDALKAGKKAYMISMEDILTCLRTKDISMSALTTYNKWLKADLLAIDDIMLFPVKKEESASFFNLVNSLHEKTSVIITTNKAPTEWVQTLNDEVLATAVMSVVEIIKKKGYVNVDFEDVKTVMKDSGLALMGCGVGKGQNRIDDAIEAAINSPLLNDFEVNTAQKVLLNITVANNENGIEMDDLNTLTNKIRDALGKFTMFKRGIIWNDDPDADDTIRVTVVATGFEYNKLNKITNVDLGNLIILDNDYVFDKKRVMDSEEGRSLPATEGSVIQTIGFNTQSSHPVFDEQNKPVLLMENGEDFSTLENIPAIRRSTRNEK